MKSKIPLVQAQSIAAQIVDALSPYCERIEIAGSIRRKKSVVGDVEIVAMPRGDNRPIEFYATLLNAEPMNAGEKYMKLSLPCGIQLDLFWVFDLMQWGYIFCQRTGPAEFNKYLFTRRPYGVRPSGLEANDGYIYLNGELQDTSTEPKFLACFGLDYIDPEQRQTWNNVPRQQDPLVSCFASYLIRA